MTKRLGLLAEGLCVVTAFAILAMLLTWPLFADPGHSVLDPSRPWLSGALDGAVPGSRERAMLRDIHLLVWVYAWDWHALTTQPGALFDANIFHPLPGALAYSEHVLGKLPITGPILALSGNPVLAYQLDLLLSFALSAGAMYALLRAIGAVRGAAFFASFVYAFAPVRMDALYHPHLLAGQYFPLVLLFLDRALFGGRTRDAVAFAVLLLLQLLTSYYVAYQTVFALGAYAVAALWCGRAQLPPRGTPRVALAATAVFGIFGLLSAAYLRGRSSGLILRYDQLGQGLLPLSNDLWRSYLLSPILLHAHLVPALARGGHAYVGVLVLGLAIASRRRRADGDETALRHRVRVAALAIAVVSWTMALGPAIEVGDNLLPLPYAAAMRIVPGFDSMRVPYRFALMMMFGIALLAGLGADRLMRALSRRFASRLVPALVSSLLVAVTALDFGFGFDTFPTRRLEAGRNAPPVYAALAALPRGPLLEIPGSVDGVRESEAMVHSTSHWLPLVLGSSGYAPPTLPIVVGLAARLPARQPLKLLMRLTGLRYVVVHLDELPREQWARWEAPPGLRRIGVFGTDLLFAANVAEEADLQDEFVRCAHDPTTCANLRQKLQVR